MKTAAVLLALAVLTVSGCLNSANDSPTDPIDRDDAEFKRVHEWNTTHQGSLGLRIHVEADTHCQFTIFLRGRSTQYERVGHFGVYEDSEYENDPISTSATSSGPGTIAGVRAYASVAGMGAGTAIDHEAEWVRTIGTGFTFDGKGTVFVAFVGLDSSVPVPDYYAREDRYYWQPEPETSATWRMKCDEPVRYEVDMTERVFLFDDQTLRGDGVAATAAASGGTTLAVAAATGINVDVRGELAFFAEWASDPESVVHLSLQGPGVDRSWFGPPTTYILGIGDAIAHAGGPAGAYRMEWKEVGATFFAMFYGAFYDFDAPLA